MPEQKQLFSSRLALSRIDSEILALCMDRDDIKSMYPLGGVASKFNSGF